jgi:hypothetical protein
MALIDRLILRQKAELNERFEKMDLSQKLRSSIATTLKATNTYEIVVDYPSRKFWKYVISHKRYKIYVSDGFSDITIRRLDVDGLNNRYVDSEIDRCSKEAINVFEYLLK